MVWLLLYYRGLPPPLFNQLAWHTTTKGKSTRVRLGLGRSMVLGEDGKSKAFGSLGYSNGGGQGLSASVGVKLAF